MTVDVMVHTRTLSLHISTTDYNSNRARIDANFQIIGTHYTEHSRNMRYLTVSRGTLLHTLDHFRHYTATAVNNHDAALVYMPSFAPRPQVPVDAPRICSAVGACIQQSTGPYLIKAPGDGPDLLLESGTDLVTTRQLAKNIHGISLFGGKNTSNYSVGEMCRILEVYAQDPLRFLRFQSLGTVTVDSTWDLSWLTTVEAHDCSNIESLLRAIGKYCTKLRRVVFADSGYQKPKPGNKGSAKSILDGKQLIRVLGRNPNLVYVCVTWVCSVNTVQRSSEHYPHTVKHLVLVHATGDILQPGDYAALVVRCPHLQFLGTTMFFAKRDDRNILDGKNKQDLLTICRYLGRLLYLGSLTVVRFAANKEYKPHVLASYLFELIHKPSASMKTISVVRRQKTHSKTNPRVPGDHFELDDTDTLVKLSSVDMDWKMITNLRFASALFARDMQEFAKSEGIRYQLDPSEDEVTKLGWSEANYGYLQV